MTSPFLSKCTEQVTYYYYDEYCNGIGKTV